ERLNLVLGPQLVPEGFRQIADPRQIVLGSLVEVEGELARAHASVWTVTEGLAQLLAIHPDQGRLGIRQYASSLPFAGASPSLLRMFVPEEGGGGVGGSRTHNRRPSAVNSPSPEEILQLEECR